MEVNQIKNHIKRVLIKSINFIAGTIELLVLTVIPNRAFPSIWIIGPPRSGTTLLYQVLTKRYKIAYISNFAAMFHKAPIIASLVVCLLFKSQNAVIEFRSNYGRTPNWMGAHEAGKFWYRWFPRGEHVYVPPQSISQRKLQCLKKEIVGLSLLAKAPVLFKNVYNSMRIAPIVETCPNAYFLVCRRDPVDVAQSILNGRIKLYGDKSKWMSVPPKEIDDIKRHPYWEQVVEQVYYVYRQIEMDKQRYGNDRFFEVDYEQLCKNPMKILMQMEQFFLKHHIKLQVVSEIPNQFPFSTGKRVSDEDYQHILETTSKLWQ